jgi:hypothetical protein
MTHRIYEEDNTILRSRQVLRDVKIKKRRARRKMKIMVAQAKRQWRWGQLPVEVL